MRICVPTATASYRALSLVIFAARPAATVFRLRSPTPGPLSSAGTTYLMVWPFSTTLKVSPVATASRSPVRLITTWM